VDEFINSALDGSNWLISRFGGFTPLRTKQTRWRRGSTRSEDDFEGGAASRRRQIVLDLRLYRQWLENATLRRNMSLPFSGSISCLAYASALEMQMCPYETSSQLQTTALQSRIPFSNIHTHIVSAQVRAGRMRVEVLNCVDMAVTSDWITPRVPKFLQWAIGCAGLAIIVLAMVHGMPVTFPGNGRVRGSVGSVRRTVLVLVPKVRCYWGREPTAGYAPVLRIRRFCYL
jgi:hypothetical protein